jgi:uracil-DNA glycosylase
MAAVCRCFPGKAPGGGDRVPAPDEIAHCAPWLDAEVRLLRPALVVPVGRLAIAALLAGSPAAGAPLAEVIGRRFRAARAGRRFDVVPLPHPSGASTWHRVEPGVTLLARALRLIAAHPAWARAVRALRPARTVDSRRARPL